MHWTLLNHLDWNASQVRHQSQRVVIITVNTGVSMMAGMNGLVNGKSNGKTVAHRATHHGDMTPKTAEGNKPYICKGN